MRATPISRIQLLDSAPSQSGRARDHASAALLGAPDTFAVTPESMEMLGAWLGSPVCFVDPDFRIVAVDHRYAEAIHRSASEIAGRSISDIVGAGNWALLKPFFDRARAGESLTIELAHSGHGNPRNSVMRFRALRNSAGATRGVLISVSEAAATSNVPPRGVETLPQPIGMVDLEGNLVWANGALRMLLERSRGAAIADWQARVADAINDEHQVSIEFVLPGLTTPRWFRVDITPTFDAAGKAYGAYLFWIDVEEAHEASRQLAEREIHFRGFTENIPEAIGFLDRNRRYKYVNQAFLNLCGKKLEEVLGRSVEEVVGPRIASLRRSLFERAIRGEMFSLETHDELRSGVGWRELRYLPYRNSEGVVEGVYVVSRDIEESKQAQLALRVQETRLRLLTDTLPAQITHVDADLVFKYCNRKFFSDYGLTEEQVIGRTVGQVFGAERAAEIATELQRTVEGEAVEFERKQTLADGKTIWSRVSFVNSPHDPNQPASIYGISFDITEARLAQERLQQQQTWIENFLTNFPLALAYLDPSGTYSYVNRAFAALLGRPATEIVGASLADASPPEAATAMTAAFQQSLGQSTSRTEHEWTQSQGNHRWVAVDWMPDRSESGNLRGLYTLSQDVSEARQTKLDYDASVRELQRAMDSVALPISYIDSDERIRFVNHTSTIWYGRASRDLVGMSLTELMPADEYQFAKPYIDAALSGQLVQFEREVRFHDGVTRWVLLRYVPTRNETDIVTGFYTTATDIQARKKQELALQQANWLLTAHFENTPLASFTLDSEMVVTRWSSQAETLFGWPRSEVVDRPFSNIGIIEPVEAEQFFPRSGTGAVAEPQSQRHLASARRRDGGRIACEWHIAVLRDPLGRVISVLGLVQDISQRIVAENRLIESAQRDTLTNLLNRNALEPTLRSYIEQVKREATGLAVLFIDLDHFKNINDTLGHRVGDLMLIEIADTLRNCIRPNDEVARIGGDEFMVIIAHHRPKAIAHETAERIIHALGTPIRVENQRLSVAASIGVAVYPDHGRTPEALLRSADLAMYKAKENGKNRFEFFSAALAQRSERRTGIKNALRLALQRDALRLHYQPRVRVSDGIMVGAEALLRWTDPRLGVVSPKEFISIAEESGLIHELGLFVFRKACQQIQNWQQRGMDIGMISINFSAHQLLVATFIDEVDRVIEETGCDPRSIEVEITETSMLFDLGITKNVIADLKHRGMHIAIDDFGTGFSSLSHLQQLDIDTLKIDQSFIRDMLDDASDFAITRSVISLGRGLGLSVTAEGVENERQLSALREAGCDYYQGFLFSPAVTIEDIEVLMDDSAARVARVAARL